MFRFTPLVVNSMWEFYLSTLDDILANAPASLSRHLTLKMFLKIVELSKTALEANLFSTENTLRFIKLLDSFLPTCGEIESLRDHIMELLYVYWVKEYPDGKSIWSNCFTSYLDSSLKFSQLSKNAPKIFKLKEGLKDLSSCGKQEINSLLEMLAKCVVSEQFLLCGSGRTFISFMLTFDPFITEKVHEALTSSIHCMKETTISAIVEVYLEAWNMATSEQKVILKESCMKDLILKALNPSFHASYTAALNLFFLKLHEKGPNVMYILCRCYGSLIKNCLHTERNDMRLLAVKMFLSILPFPEDSSNHCENFSLKQQILLISSFLKDKVPEIRVIAIKNMFQVLKLYWENLPVNLRSKILKILLKENSRDATSEESRIAVCEGLQLLLQNSAIHSTIQSVLLVSKHLIDDPCISVQLTYLSFLCNLKDVELNYTDVISVEMLMQVLSKEPNMCQKIMYLLKDELWLTGEKLDLTSHCIKFMRTDRKISRTFYCSLQGLLPAEMFIEMITSVCHIFTFVMHNDIELPSDENTTVSKNNVISVSEDTVEGLLDILSILLINLQLAKDETPLPENARNDFKNVEKQLAMLLDYVFQKYTNLRIQNSAFYLSSFLPMMFSKKVCISHLTSLNKDTTSDEFGGMLMAMLRWGMGVDVINIMCDWISSVMVKESLLYANKINPRSVKHTELKPELGLKFIEFFFETPSAWNILWEEHSAALFKLWRTMIKVVEHEQQGIRNSDNNIVHYASEIYRQFLVLTLLLEGQIGEDKQTPFCSSSVILRQIESFQDNLLPLLPFMNENQRSHFMKFILELLVACDSVFKFGFSDLSFAWGFYNFCVMCNTLNAGISLSPMKFVLKTMLVNFALIQGDMQADQNLRKLVRSLYTELQSQLTLIGIM